MRISKLSIAMGILFLGAIWGLLEATMGNILHWVGLHPYTGAVMTSFAIGFLTFGRQLYPRRWSSIAMAVIAAAFKALDFLVPGSNVVRPIVAILAIGLAFEGAMYVTEKMKQTQLLKATTGLIVGYVSIAAFTYFTAYVIQYYYWLNKGVLGILKYLGTHGWMFGAGGAIMALAGYNLQGLLERATNWVKFIRTKAFNYVAISTGALCMTLIIII